MKVKRDMKANGIICFVLSIIVIPLLVVFQCFFESVPLPTLFTIRRIILMAKTLGFGFLVTFNVLWLSFFLSYHLFRAQLNKKRLMALLLCLIVIPPFMYAYFWISGMQLLLNINQIYGFVSSCLVQSIYFLPLGMLVWIQFFFKIGEEYYYESYLNIEINKGHFLTCLIMGQPMAISLFGLVFVLSITDFSIPSIFGFNTYPIEMMSSFSSSYELSSVIYTSLPFSFILFGIVYITYLYIKKQEIYLELFSGDDVKSLLKIGKEHKSVYLIILVCMLPFVQLFYQVLKTPDFLDTVTRYSGDVYFSVITAFISAFIILVASYILSYYLLNRPKAKKIVYFLVLGVFSIPSTMIGILVNTFYNKVITWSWFFEWIYYSYIPTIHVYVLRFLPIGFLMMQMGFLMLSLQHIEEVRFHTKKDLLIAKTGTWFQIKDFAISSLLLCTIFGIGELGGSIMVVPPGKSTMTITIYNYLHYGSTEVVSSLVFVLISIIVLILSGVYYFPFLSRRSR